MEKYFLKDDIKVFYVQASSFPQGIMPAWQKLHSLLPNSSNRKFFGLSGATAPGHLYYQAAVEESYPGEAQKLGCETYTIPKGEYTSVLIKDYENDIPAIGRTFSELLKHPRLNPNSVCVEIYEGEKDVRCMVSLISG